MVDARLPDGSRVNAIIPPLSLSGPLMTIRKFSKRRLTLEDMINIGSISEESAEFLSRCIEAQLNLLVSGGTGSGKTTLLNALSASIPNNERIVTIEDAAELQLNQRHVLRLEARPPNIEGEGHIPIRDLVRNSLRMRPDRILVGEVRGAEALDMLQAMNTGHDGSLSTVHSNSPRDALHRIETMVMMAGYDLPLRAIRQHVSAALDLLVHIDRMEDGSRRIVAITEVLRMESDVIQLQDIFEFEIESVAPDRTITGKLRPTGLRPVFLDKFRKRGIELPQSMFGERITDARRSARRDGVRRLVTRHAAAASAAVAALVAAGLALGQSGAPKLTRVARLGLPGSRVPAPAPERADARRRATSRSPRTADPSAAWSASRPRQRSERRVLLIDASNSMKGAPIEGAMAAARAFLKERKPNMPVAVVVFNPEQTRAHRLHDRRPGARTRRSRQPRSSRRARTSTTRSSRPPTWPTSQGLRRATIVLLSDGTDVGSEASRAEALEALDAANMRVISVGLRVAAVRRPRRCRRSPAQHRRPLCRDGDAGRARAGLRGDRQSALERVRASRTARCFRRRSKAERRGHGRRPPGGDRDATRLPRSTSPARHVRADLDRQRDHLAVPRGVHRRLRPRAPRVRALRRRSTRAPLACGKRMSQYVSVPTEDEGRMRRAEVAAMLAAGPSAASKAIAGGSRSSATSSSRGFKSSAVTIAGWTIVARDPHLARRRDRLPVSLGPARGLIAPFVTRASSRAASRRSAKRSPSSSRTTSRCSPGALRAGHSLIGAMDVMVDGATEPSKSEFRRVLQDEQLGVPLDDALMVMWRRMDNLDVEQVAIVTRLQREAGGNTAEVLDRVVENIRGRMELQRLVHVLTAQGRIARYILTAIPIFLLLFFFSVNKVWLEPLWETDPGHFALGHRGSFMLICRLVRNQEDRRDRGLDMGIEIIAVAGVLLLGGGRDDPHLQPPPPVEHRRRSIRSGPTGTSPRRRRRRRTTSPARRPLDSLAGTARRHRRAPARALQRERGPRRSSSPPGCTGRPRASFSAIRSCSPSASPSATLWIVPLLGGSAILTVVARRCRRRVRLVRADGVRRPHDAASASRRSTARCRR